MNLRREFFRVDFDIIRKLVEELCGHVEYSADPEALEYLESQKIADEDLDELLRINLGVRGDQPDFDNEEEEEEEEEELLLQDEDAVDLED